MKKVLLICLFLIAFCFLNVIDVGAEERQRSYFIYIKFNQGNVSIENVDVSSGYLTADTIYKDKNPYKLIIMSYSGKVLSENVFTINAEASFDDIDSSNEVIKGNINLEEVEKLIIMPYFSDGKKILLLDSNEKLIDQKDISHLSETCGDGECADYENYLSCEKDCPSDGHDGYCNKQKINEDPDCLTVKQKNLICDANGICSNQETEQNCPQDCVKIEQTINKINLKIIILIIVIVVVICIMILAYIFLVKPRKTQDKIDNIDINNNKDKLT